MKYKTLGELSTDIGNNVLPKTLKDFSKTFNFPIEKYYLDGVTPRVMQQKIRIELYYLFMSLQEQIRSYQYDYYYSKKITDIASGIQRPIEKVIKDLRTYHDAHKIYSENTLVRYISSYDIKHRIDGKIILPDEFRFFYEINSEIVK